MIAAELISDIISNNRSDSVSNSWVVHRNYSNLLDHEVLPNEATFTVQRYGTLGSHTTWKHVTWVYHFHFKVSSLKVHYSLIMVHVFYFLSKDLFILKTDDSSHSTVSSYGCQ